MRALVCLVYGGQVRVSPVGSVTLRLLDIFARHSFRQTVAITRPDRYAAAGGRVESHMRLNVVDGDAVPS